MYVDVNITERTNNKTAPLRDNKTRIPYHWINEPYEIAWYGRGFQGSLAGTTPQSMTADTFLSMLLARKWDYRAQATIARLTKNAAFRYKAYIEQIDYATNRGLERNQMERLATLDFVHKAQNPFITGSSGTGKSYLACALDTSMQKGIPNLLCQCPETAPVTLKVAKSQRYT